MEQAANTQQNIQPILGGVPTRAERERLLRVAAAACLLLRELDGDTFETFESAELLAHCLGGLPEETVREALALCSVM